MEPADLEQRHHSPRVLRLDRSRLGRVAEDGIAVAKQVARQLIKQEHLSQLLPRSSRRRMSRHICSGECDAGHEPLPETRKDHGSEGSAR